MTQRYTIWALIVLVTLSGFFMYVEDLNRYPAGVTDDEATQIVDAHFFTISGKFPFLIYDSSPRGGEITNLLIQGIMAYFAGPSPFVSRLTGAFTGVLGIAAAFWASKESLVLLFPKSPREWHKLSGLLGACLYVFAIGYLTLARSPNRSMYQILFTLLLIGFLARAMRRWQWRDFIATGIFLGLLLYTYTAAYLLPFAMVPFGFVLVLREWSNRKRVLPRLMLSAAIATIIILPIIIGLSDATNYRLRRIDDARGDVNLSIRAIVTEIGEYFFTRGSGLPAYNTANAPLVPAVFIPFLALGLLVLLWRLGHPLSIFILSAFILVLVPLVLAGELKHGLRVSGVYAIFPVVVAFGAYLLLSFLARFVSSKWLNRASPPLMMLILFLGAWQARGIYRDYWQHPENYKLWHIFELDLTHSEWFYRADRREFAEWLISLDVPILIPADEVIEIPTRVWLLNEYPHVVTTERFFDLPENTEFVMPYTIGYASLRSETRDYVLLMDDTVYLLPPLDAASHEHLLASLDGAEALYREGIIDFLGYHRALAEDFTLGYEAANTVFPAQFDNQLAVINWRGDDSLVANEPSSLSVNLEWTALNPMWDWYWVTVQMETQDRVFVAREDTNITNNQRHHILRWLYPTALWQIGDMVPYRVILDVPALDAGAYRLTAGVYEIPNRSLPADTDPYGNPTIGWIKVGSANRITIPASAQAVGAVFEESIELTAMELLPQDNGQVLLQFYWTSLVHRPAFDAFIFVHLYDDNGTIVSQVDARPQDGNYPTLIWDANEIVMTEYLLSAADLTGLNLRAGAYIFPDGVNLQHLGLSMNGEQVADNILILGRLSDWLND